MALKLGSLFDGSGTAPLAATMCGIEPVWASEIEPYPIKVTKARFPNMKHLGSITDIDGATVEPVDIICGGSPCQDLSVAGKQKGLHEGERSHLFFEMTRIIKQMREETNGKYPRYVIWENVPGAFSSNNGRDFYAVLQVFAEIADPDIYVPEPPCKGKTDRLAWRYAGSVVGDGWSIAWRTVDAQYWGVPQRRRRIYLVADLGSERADEILFERTGLSGHPEPSGTPGQEIAADAGISVDRGCAAFAWANSDNAGLTVSERITPTIKATRCGEPAIVSDRGSEIVCLNDQGGNVMSVSYDCTATLRAQEHGHQPVVAGFVGSQGAKSGSVGFEEGILPTLRQGITTDVVFDITGVNSNSIKSPTPDSCFKQRDIGRTLDTFVGSPECNQGGMVVVSSVDCRNIKLNEELSCTLQAKSVGGYSLNYQNPVLYEAHGFGRYRDGCGTLRASGGDCGPGSEMLCVEESKVKTSGFADDEVFPDVTGALCANSHPGSYTGQDAFNNMLPVVPSDKPPRKYIVRRLTPLECCRLQGFPDWWEDGVEGSDSARYKMWGNGMALPNMLHVMQGIVIMENQSERS